MSDDAAITDLIDASEWETGTTLWDGAHGSVCTFDGSLDDAMKELNRAVLQHPEAEVVIVAAFGSAAQTWRRRTREVSDGDIVALQSLIDVMMPAGDIPTPALVEQARRNAELRQSVIDEFGGLGSAGVARLIGSRAENTAAAAQRLVQQRRIFGVRHGTERVFLGFQFQDDGQTWPSVRGVLEVLEHRSGWELAAWFVTPNAWLDARRPVDLLADADLLVTAARHDAELPL